MEVIRTLLALAGVALAAYLLVLALVYFNQERMLFLPAGALAATPRDIGLDFSDVRIRTGDGETLHAWSVPARDATHTLLFFHGNAGNISHRLHSLAQFHRLGLAVLIVDYRGYGASSGTPSEAGTYRDASAAWDYLTRIRGVDPAKIVLFGRSLGGAVAIELATRVPCAGLLVESSFTSLPDLAATLYPFLPARRLARLHYPSVARIPTVRCPLLVLHSREDDIVPFAHGQALFDAAAEPKQLFTMRGGHNDGFLASGAAYEQAISDFVAALPRR